MQIWRLAGSRISEFCHGYPTSLLQEVPPSPRHDVDTNYLHRDESVFRKRPKRQTTTYFRGRRYRGQTQSQYLNVGNGNQAGKAEAESTPEGSRAVVSEYILTKSLFSSL